MLKMDKEGRAGGERRAREDGGNRKKRLSLTVCNSTGQARTAGLGLTASSMDRFFYLSPCPLSYLLFNPTQKHCMYTGLISARYILSSSKSSSVISIIRDFGTPTIYQRTTADCRCRCQGSRFLRTALPLFSPTTTSVQTTKPSAPSPPYKLLP
jgi:hypothetical protein